MKKDHIRDYATEAFKYYAEIGQPTYEKLKEKYYQEALTDYGRIGDIKGNCVSKPTEAALMYAENVLHQKESELLDILAVERTIMQLDRFEKQAVEIIYFEEPKKEFEKGDISNRVQKASLLLPAGERTIYRYLQKARSIFAYERKLRK